MCMGISCHLGHQLLTHLPWQQVSRLHRARGAQIQTNCHSDCLVLYTEAKGRNWQGFQPGSRFLCSCSGVGCRLQELVSSRCHYDTVPDFWHDWASSLRGQVAVTFWPLCLGFPTVERNIGYMWGTMQYTRSVEAAVEARYIYIGWWCYLHSISYTQPTWPYRKCGLAPVGAFSAGGVDVGDLTNNGLKMIVIFWETRRQEVVRKVTGSRVQSWSR